MLHHELLKIVKTPFKVTSIGKRFHGQKTLLRAKIAVKGLVIVEQRSVKEFTEE